jgi:protein TonB
MSTIIKADLDELVFRSRNKEYGAYLLRKIIPKNTFQALIASILIVGILIAIPTIASIFSELTAEEEVVQTDIVLEEPPPLDEEEAPPPPEEVQPPPPPQRSQVQYVPPAVVDVEEAPEEVTIVNLDTVRDDLGTENIEGDPDAPPEVLDLDQIGNGQPVEINVPTNTDPDEGAFVMLDEQPAAVNMDELKRSIEYPQMARDAGITGKVILRVLIDEQGRYVRHIVKRSPNPWLTQAVEKHINKIRFTPAIQGGRPIKTWVTVPFDFNFNN